MQVLATRIGLPHGFAHRYRCVVTHGHSYTMEEWSNIIWLGGFIARCGPLGFQKLWAHMYKFLRHYIYGVDVKADDVVPMHAAHGHLCKYAEELDRMVGREQVRAWCWQLIDQTCRTRGCTDCTATCMQCHQTAMGLPRLVHKSRYMTGC